MKKKFIIEQLEERLMLSADFLPVPFDGGLPYDEGTAALSVVETPLFPNISESQNVENAELQRHELIFIDSRVPEYQKLIDDIMTKQGEGTHFEVIVLDSNHNGIEQISGTLNTYANIDAVHLFSHGSDGAVQLGNTWLNLETLDTYADSIETWKNSLTGDADLLIYGCDVAAGESGQALVESLGILTGTDIAASTDLTGVKALGGDWKLEYTVGNIESNVAVSSVTQADWANVLVNITGSIYMEDGTTPIGSQHTVSLVNNGSLVTSVLTDAAGNYTLNETINSGDNFLIYINDGNASTVGISFVTSDGNDINLDIYQDTTIIRGNSSGNATTSDLQAALGAYSDNELKIKFNGTELDNKLETFYVPAGVTFTAEGNVIVDSMELEGTIDGGDYAFEVQGDWDASSGTFTGGSGSTITFTSGAQVAFDPGTTSTYWNITLKKGGSKTVELDNDLTVNGNLTIINGTLDVSVSNSTITVTGDFSNDDTFIAGSGTVILNGTNQTISGSTTFYNLTKSAAGADTLSFGAGDTVSIAPSGTLTLNGLNAGQKLTVTSSSPGSHWQLELSPGSFTSLDYLDVSWADASLSDGSHIPIEPANSTDSGNNSSWFSAAVNNSPSSSGISDITVNEGALNTVIDLFAVFEDAEDADPDLVYAIMSNDNPGLFSTTPIDGVLGTLTLNYAPAQTGTALITVRATDTLGLYTESTFTVKVNVAPVISWDPDNSGGGADDQGFETIFLEGGAAQTVGDTDSSMVDSDDTTLSKLTLTAGGILDGANEIITIGGSAFAMNADKTVTVTVGLTDFDIAYTTATGEFSINLNGGGDMPIADLNALLQGITYQNTLADPTDGDRTLSAVTNDGYIDSNIALATINVNPINDKPIGGFSAGNVIPQTEITQANNGSGIITINWKATDGELNNVTLKDFEYSEDGSTWHSLASNSGALSPNWDDNGGPGWSTVADFTNPAFHNFTFDTQHSDLSLLLPLAGVTTDIQIRFTLNDGTDNSDTPVTSEVFTVDNEITPTITDAHFHGGGNYLHVNGSDFNTVAPDNTDIKSLVDWSKIIWNINGGPGTITFVQSDILSADIEKDDEIKIHFTAAKEIAMEAIPDFGSDGGADTLTVIPGFFRDAFGNVATTDGTGSSTPPDATNLNANETYTEDTLHNFINDIVTSDPDSGSLTVSLKLSDPSAGDLIIGTAGTATSTFDNVTGIWEVSGDVADVNTLLGNLEFDPAQHYDSDFTITATVSDGISAPKTGTITMTATPDNDPPVVSATASDSGTEDTDKVYTHAEMLTLIGASDVDDLDANLSISITNVVNGTLALSGGSGGAGTTFTFTPTLNFVGNMTFDYQVADDDSDSSAVGTATVAFSADNDDPTVSATASDTGTEDTDQVYTHAEMLTLIGASDVDDLDANLSISISNVVNGTLALSGGTGGAGTTFTFTPTLNFVGNMTFDYQVADDDSDSSAVGTATVALSADNDAPSVSATASDTGTEDTDQVYTHAEMLTLIGASDVDDLNANLFINITNVVNGTVALSGGSGGAGTTFTFTPTLNFVGNITFNYQVSDDSGASSSVGTASIALNSVGDTPQVSNTATPPDTLSDPMVISPNAGDGVEVTHFQITGITNGTLYHADGTTPINNGDYITLTQAQNGLTFQLAANTAFGSFSVRPSKDGTSVDPDSGSATPIITVLSAPADPVIENIPDTEEVAETEELTDEETDTSIEDTNLLDESINDNTGNVASGVKYPEKNSTASVSSASHTAGKGGIRKQVKVDFKPIMDRLSGSANSDSDSSNVLSILSLEKQFNKMLDTLPIFRTSYENLKNTLDDFRKEAEMDMENAETVIGSAIAVSTGLSVGYVVWVIRGGMLISTLMSSMPAWQLADPLPILKTVNDDDDDDESLESIIKKTQDTDDKKTQGPEPTGD